MKIIDESWVEALTYGSIFLGSGGGGKTSNLIPQVYSALRGNMVRLLSVEELDPDAYYCGVAMIGSPEITAENLPAGWEGKAAVERLAEKCHRRFSGICAVEGAGVNIFYPLLTAVRAGLPLVDADSMGRAFPELQMTTYYLHGLSASPFVLIDGFGEISTFDTEDTFFLELKTREVIGKKGGMGFFAAFPKSGEEIKKYLIPGTISWAMEIGSIFCKDQDYNGLLQDVIEVTRSSLYGPVIELFRGEVTDISVVENMSVQWRTITLSSNNAEFQVLFKYENLIAFRNHKLAAMVPDLIIFIDLESLLPLNNIEVRLGQEVAVWGLPAPLIWRIKRALDLVGPSCFGYRSAYVPLEKLYPEYYFPAEVI